MQNLLSLACGAALLTVPCLAQTQNIAWTNGASPQSTNGNAFPFGDEGTRYQQIIPQSVLGSSAAWINDVFVTGFTRDAEIVYGDIEIRMGITQQATPTTNWTANNPSPTTIYRGPLRVRFAKDKWTALGLPASFRWAPTNAGDHLCFEVIQWKVLDKGGSTALQFYHVGVDMNGPRAYHSDWTTNQTQPPSVSASRACRLGFVRDDGNFLTLGSGCPGTNGTPIVDAQQNTWPMTGKPFNVLVRNAPKSQIAFLFYGLSTSSWAGVPLPFDLAPLGAPGCIVWCDQFLARPAFVDANGNGSALTLIPPSFPRVRMYVQWWCVDQTANAAGIITSDYGVTIWG